jgi:hypothetical protein
VAELAKKAGGAQCARANVAALQVFENRFLRSIYSPKDNFMEFTAPGIDFGGTELVGGPHFSAADKASETKFVRRKCEQAARLLARLRSVSLESESE